MTRLAPLGAWGGMMKLDEPYRLLVIGDTRKVPSTHRSIPYLLERLLIDQEVEMSGVRNFGIEVRQLEENDEVISVPVGEEF